MVTFEIKELIVLFTIWICWTLIVTLVLNWVSEKTIDAVWKRREKKDIAVGTVSDTDSSSLNTEESSDVPVISNTDTEGNE